MVRLIDVSDIVFTKVKYTVKAKYPLADYTNAIQGSPTTFPCLYINQFDNPVSDTNLVNDECAVSSNVQIKAFTTGTTATTTARGMLALADEAMRKMGYRRTFGPKDMEVTNPTQWVSRYARTIASGDVV